MFAEPLSAFRACHPAADHPLSAISGAKGYG
jgi:hypothetical protein